MRVPRPAATVPGASRAHSPTIMTTEHVFPQALQAGNLAQATGGMTLRDYFAAQAMQGICASGPSISFTNDRIAEEAYAMADAMLRARQQTTTE